MFSPYKYSSPDIVRSLIYTFKNVCPTVCSFDRPLFLFPHIQSVILNKRLSIHSTASSFSLFLSRLLLRFISYRYIYIFFIQRKANYGCHFISYSSYRHHSTYLKCRRYFQIAFMTIIQAVN